MGYYKKLLVESMGNKKDSKKKKEKKAKSNQNYIFNDAYLAELKENARKFL